MASDHELGSAEWEQLRSFLWKSGLVFLILGVGNLAGVGLLMDLSDGFVPGVLIGILAAAVLYWYKPVQPMRVAPWADVPVEDRPDVEVLNDCIRRFRQPHIDVLGVVPVLLVVLGYLLIAHQLASQFGFYLGSDAIPGFLLGFGSAYGLIRAAECLQVRAALDTPE